MKESIRVYVGFAATMAVLAGIVLLVFCVFMGVIALLTPSSRPCVVTLATGKVVTRHGCYSYKSDVLHCAEADYAPAEWATVTCERGRW